MPTVTLAHSAGGDWHALYIDGQKVSENHSLSSNDILKALGIEYQNVELSDEWLEKNGSYFPDVESDLPKPKKRRK